MTDTPTLAYGHFEREDSVLASSHRTGAPTRDPRCGQFFGMPYDDYSMAMRDLRDEAEHRAYLAIVAAAEGVLQTDFRARARARKSALLSRESRGWWSAPRRIEVEEILDVWGGISGIRQAPIGEFRQLLRHRHWLAHGRYFPDCTAVPPDPGFAFNRAQALVGELQRLDPDFPRGVERP